MYVCVCVCARARYKVNFVFLFVCYIGACVINGNGYDGAMLSAFKLKVNRGKTRESGLVRLPRSI